MAKDSILFIDLLGVQRMWAENGAAAVKERMAEFSDFVIKQLGYLPNDLHRDGGYTAILASDGVSVICQDHEQAIGIGCHLFVQAFYDSDKRKRPFWLRGAIGKWHNQYLPMNTRPIQAKNMQIGTQYVTEDDFHEVLALEKSGYRGMRLIIDKCLLPNDGFTFQRHWPSCKKSIGYVVALKEFNYPSGGKYADVLWMTDAEANFNQLKGIMARRFKTCSQNELEFVQAAWTRSVFDQVDSIISGCK